MFHLVVALSLRECFFSTRNYLLSVWCRFFIVSFSVFSCADYGSFSLSQLAFVPGFIFNCAGFIKKCGRMECFRLLFRNFSLMVVDQFYLLRFTAVP